MRFFILFLLAAPAFFISGAASAQTPSSVEPGKIERQFAPQIQPKTEREQLVEPLPQQDTSGASGVTFTLKSVAVQGNNVVSTEELAPIYRDRIGQTVSFSDLNQIADAISQYYRDKGYILARAYIPPQKVEGGNVTIRVVEGFIDEVTFDGTIKGDRSLLDSFANKIKASVPLTSASLERYMLLMDDLPGVTARGLLRPSTDQVGAADLVIVLEHETFEGSVEANNRGTRYLGPYQVSLVGAMNSVFDNYERTTFQYVNSTQVEELKFFDIAHTQQIGKEGTTGTLAFSRTLAKPGSTLKSSDLYSQSFNAGGTITHPILRSREQNLFARTGLLFRETVTDEADSLLTKDKVRVAKLGAQYDVVDGIEGVNLIDLEYNQGLDIYDATDREADASRTNGRATFSKGIVNLSRYQPLPQNFGLLLSSVGQYASGPLLASEEIGIGGANFGKAYDPSEISGDHGLAGKVELQYNMYHGYDYLDASQVYVFYDGGKIWNDSEVTGEDETASLSSAGVGVRMNLMEKLTGYVEVGFPLTRDVAAEGTEGDDPRVFFSVVKQF